MVLIFLVCLNILSLVFGLIGFYLGLTAKIEILAMQKSTHKIQYLGVNSQGLPEIKDDYQDFDSDLEDFRKQQKDALEEGLNFFVEDDLGTSSIADENRSF